MRYPLVLLCSYVMLLKYVMPATCPTGNLGYVPGSTETNFCYTGSNVIVNNFNYVKTKSSTTETYIFTTNSVIASTMTNNLPSQPIYKQREDSYFNCQGSKIRIGCSLDHETEEMTTPTTQPIWCKDDTFGYTGGVAGFTINGMGSSTYNDLVCWCIYDTNSCSFKEVTLSNPLSGKVALVNSNSHSQVGVTINRNSGFLQVFNFALKLNSGEQYTFTGTISVCGAEYFELNNANSQNTLDYVKSNSEIDIYTTQQSNQAFIINNKGQSDVSCWQIDRQNLYSDTSGSNVFTHNQIWLDKNDTSQIRRYPIRINLANATTTPIIFYLIEKTQTEVSPPVKFDVMICGLETIQASAGAQTYKYVQQTGSLGLVISVSTLNSFFTTQVNNAVTTRCGIVQYSLTSDTSGTAWNQTSKVNIDSSITTDAPLYPVRIFNSVSFSEVTLYVEATTKSGKKAYKELKIKVCGIYTGTTTVLTTNFTYVSNKTQTSETIDPASWFTLSQTFTTSMCEAEFYIAQDALGATPNATSPLTYDSNSTPNSVGVKKLIIDRSQYWFVNRYVILKLPTGTDSNNEVTQTLYQRMVVIEICGSETISLTEDKAYHMLITRPYYGRYSYLNDTKQTDWFKQTNNGTSCGVIKTTFLKSHEPEAPITDSMFYHYTSSNIYNTIRVYHQYQRNVTFYLKGETYSGKKAYKPIHFEVCGPPTVIEPKKVNVITIYWNDPRIVWRYENYFKPSTENCPVIIYYYSYRNYIWTSRRTGRTYNWWYRSGFGPRYRYYDFWPPKQMQQRFFIYRYRRYIRVNGKYVLSWYDQSGNYKILGYGYLRKYVWKYVRIVMCGLETLSLNTELFEANKKTFFEYQTGEGHLQYFKDLGRFINSTKPDCNVTYSFIKGGEGLKINQTTRDIQFSTAQNAYHEFTVQAKAGGGSFVNMSMTIAVCGAEIINVPSLSSISKSYPLKSRSGDVDMVQVLFSDLFATITSSDPNCPVQNFSLAGYEKAYQKTSYSNAYVKLIESKRTLKSSIQIYTSNPNSYQFSIRANTLYKSGWQPVVIRVCGNEEVTASGPEIEITFDEETKPEVMIQGQYEQYFTVNPVDCLLSHFRLTKIEGIKGQLSIGNGISMKSSTGEIVLNFKSQFEYQKKEEFTFFIQAITESNKKGYQKIKLVKKSCEFETLEVSENAVILRQFNAQSTFMINETEYLNLYTISDEEMCPITSLRLSLEEDESKRTTDLDGIAKINNKGQIKLDFPKLLETVDKKTHFFVSATDGFEHYAFIKVHLIRIPDELFQINNVLAAFVTPTNVSLDDLRITVTNVNFVGEAVIRFSHKLLEPINPKPKDINEEIMSLKVINVLDGKEHEMSWKTIKIRAREIHVQIIFEKPMEISAAITQTGKKDKLIVKMLKDTYFVGESDKGLPAYFSDQTNFAYSNVAKQLNNDAMSLALAGNTPMVEGGFNAAMMAQFALNFAFATAISLTIASFEVLQIVSFQTMMNIEYPANAQFCSSEVVNILNADALNPQWITDIFFDFEEDYQLMKTLENNYQNYDYYIIEQIKDMDFQTYNPILNMGGLLTCIIFVIGQFIIYLSFKIISKCIKVIRPDQIQQEGGESYEFVQEDIKKIKKTSTPKQKNDKKRCCLKCLNKIEGWKVSYKKKLFFGMPLIVMYESVIQLTMSYLLFLTMPRFLLRSDQKYDATRLSSFAFGYFCLFLNILLIIVTYIVSISKEQTLNNPKVKQQYGVVYYHFRKTHFRYKIQSLLFVLRRTYCCYVYLFLYRLPVMQLFAFMYNNLFMMMIIGSVKPYNHRHVNRKEICNEQLILMTTTLYFLFTDFVNDQEFKYNIAGWWYIAMIFTIIAFNCCYILGAMFKTIKLYAVKYWRKFRVKYWPNKKYAKKDDLRFKAEIELKQKVKKDKNLDQFDPFAKIEPSNTVEPNIIDQQFHSPKKQENQKQRNQLEIVSISRSILDDQKTQYQKQGPQLELAVFQMSPVYASAHVREQNKVTKKDFIRQFENELRQNQAEVFKKERRLMIRRAQIECIQKGFADYNLIDLYDAEKVKQFFIFQHYLNFVSSFDKFVQKEFDKFQQKKPEDQMFVNNFEDYKRENRKKLNVKFTSASQQFIESSSFEKQFGKWKSFEDFQLDNTYDIIKRGYLADDQSILPSAIKMSPCCYYLFEINYHPDFVHSQQTSDLELSNELKKNVIESSWSMGEFLRVLQMDSEKRMHFLLQTECENDKISKFYELAGQYLENRLKLIKAERKEMSNEMKKMENDFTKGDLDLQVKLIRLIDSASISKYQITIGQKNDNQAQEKGNTEPNIFIHDQEQN